MLPGVSHAFLQAAFAQPATDKHEQLRRQLLRYCVQHPDAKDTIEGILAWWFPRGRARWSAAEVKTTLDELIRDGLLTGRSVRLQANPAAADAAVVSAGEILQNLFDSLTASCACMRIGT